MRIVALEPYLTEIVSHFGFRESLVGVSHRCDVPEEVKDLVRVSVSKDLLASGKFASTNSYLENNLCLDHVLLADLIGLEPDLILTQAPEVEDPEARDKLLEQEILRGFGREVEVHSYSPHRLEDVFGVFESIGKTLEVAQRGRDFGQRLKAQMLDWASNFYDRMKNKRVTFLSGVTPLQLGGLWIPDMIHLASAHSHERIFGEESRRVDWDEIVGFRPDVIMVAPSNCNLREALKTFKILEKLSGWEDLPAVKRGEVYFTDGAYHFHRPGPGIRESMGILVSAIAGLESGYITPRDSFYKLRWLEIQRHRIA